MVLSDCIKLQEHIRKIIHITSEKGDIYMSFHNENDDTRYDPIHLPFTIQYLMNKTRIVES